MFKIIKEKVKRKQKREEKKMSDIEEKDRNMKEKNNLKSKTTRLKEIKNSSKGITLIALVITILFPYDEKLKCSNSKGFLLATI